MACECCGSLAAKTVELDDIEMELCSVHLAFWEGRGIKEQVAQSKYDNPARTGTRLNMTKEFTGWEIWKVDTGGTPSSLHKQVKTKKTLQSSILRYVERGDQYAVRKMTDGQQVGDWEMVGDVR